MPATPASAAPTPQAGGHDPRVSQLLLPAVERAVRQAQHELALAQMHFARSGRTAEPWWLLRLAPDMLCLAHQVQVLADGVRGTLAHLRGDPGDPCAGWVFNRGEADLPPLSGDAETLQRQLHAAQGALQRHPYAELARTPDQGAAGRAETVTVARPGLVRVFDREDFLWGLVLTNTLFHASMIHALLRHAGVPLGKADFLGRSPWPADPTPPD